MPTLAGTIVLIPESDDGHWGIDGKVGVSHVHLTQERLQESAEALTNGRPVELVYRVGFADAATTRTLASLGDGTNGRDPAGRPFLEQAVGLLCIQLLRAHSNSGALSAPVRRGGLANWQVKRVIYYMRERLEQEIGLSDLAALVKLSRFHFCTAFRMATGRTPHEWLTHERMARAKTLLADPTLRITDIALSVGYGTPSAFAATFRKVVGQTPKEFRRQLQEASPGTPSLPASESRDEYPKARPAAAVVAGRQS